MTSSTRIASLRPSSQKAFQLIIFDMDGTLVDSFPLFIRLINGFADQYGFGEINDDNLEDFRALPPEKIREKLALSSFQAFTLLFNCKWQMRKFRHVPQRFSGIDELLIQLKAQGVRLAIVSSNSKNNCQSYLGEELFSLFDFVIPNASIYGKKRQIKKIINKTQLPLSKIIYIGDQIIDIQSAHSNSIQAGAVTWGFNNRQALLAEQPHYLFEDLNQLQKLLLPQA